MGNFSCISCFNGERQESKSELPTFPTEKKIKTTSDEERKKEECNISYVLNSVNSGNEIGYNVKYKRRTDSESNFSQIGLNMNINK